LPASVKLTNFSLQFLSIIPIDFLSYIPYNKGITKEGDDKMTVKELREKLKEYPQDAKVAIYSESEYNYLNETPEDEFYISPYGDLILWCDVDLKRDK
jgi:hypothetical protein